MKLKNRNILSFVQHFSFSLLINYSISRQPQSITAMVALPLTATKKSRTFPRSQNTDTIAFRW